jgi:hypothetical protein
VNHNKLRRLYREERLQVRKRGRRQRARLARQSEHYDRRGGYGIVLSV